MKNLTQYSERIEKLFEDYLNEKKTKLELISELKILEKYHKDLFMCTNPAKIFSFKFGCKDYLSTTIEDLKNDLENVKNKNYLEEKIFSCLKIQGVPSQEKLLVFYS